MESTANQALLSVHARPCLPLPPRVQIGNRAFLLLLLSAILTWLPVRLASAAPPAPPAATPDLAVIDAFSYPNAASAQAAWLTNGGNEGDGPGSAVGAIPVAAAGRRALLLPCRFSRDQASRAYWDLPVNINLGAAAAISFDVCAENLPAISRCTLYLKSGDGWYGGWFYPESASGWSHVRLLKSEFSPEGHPSGWSRIERIRISPWAAARQDANLYLANFGAEGANSPIVVVRREFLEAHAESKGAERYAKLAVELLEEAGIETGITSTLDLSPALLRGKKVVVLPYTPDMTARTSRTIRDFVARGGKAIVCYTISDDLAPGLGLSIAGSRPAAQPGEFSSMRLTPPCLPGVPHQIDQASWRVLQARPAGLGARVAAWWHTQDGRRTAEPAIIVSTTGAFISHVLLADNRDGKRALLASLVTHFCPDVQAQRSARRINDLGRILGPFDWQHAIAHVARQPGHNSATGRLLSQAGKARRGARDFDDAGRFQEALKAADKAEDLLVEAYCRAQRPLPGEFRAIWAHEPEGLRGCTWEQSARTLAAGGIRHLIVNILRGASAGYASSVLPRHAYLPPNVDYLQECVSACSKYGIQVHVWMVNWNPGEIGRHVPAPVHARLKAAGRTQIDENGKVTDWLCPSNDQNRKLQADAMVEAACKPGVAGIQFDYIRYPNPRCCYCPTCRRTFEARLKRKVANWPDDVLEEGPLRDAWIQFRCDVITQLVRDVHTRVRSVAPHVKISAAVFKNYPRCRISNGQDWVHWINQGYLDFVCPMDYTANDAEFAGIVASQLAATRRRIPLYPGIGSYLGLGPVGTIRQINITRSHNTNGWVIFALNPSSATDTLPHLGKGITSGE